METAAKINDSLQKHTVPQSIALHVGPGILIALCYFLLAIPVSSAGFPTVAALILAAIIVLIPVELGIVYWEKRRQAAKSFANVIMYQKKLPAVQIILFVLIVTLITGLIFKLLDPVGKFIDDLLFGFYTDAYRLDFGMSGEYSKTILIITYSVGFVVLAVIAPIVEEIYFRGYLLPRVPDLKGFSVLFHSFLFAVYHFWTPWMIITRTIGVFPLAFVVKKKENILIAMISHILINSLDFITGFVFVFTLTN